MKIYISLCIFLLSGTIFGQEFDETLFTRGDHSLIRANEILEALKSPFIETGEITKLLDDPNYHFSTSISPFNIPTSIKNNSIEKNNTIQVDSAYRWFLDTLTNNWEVDSRYSFRYFYDDNNNLINYVEQYRDDNTWNSFYQYIYEYDDNNNITSKITQHNDGFGWINLSKFVKTYDQNNNLLINSIQEWNGTMWTNSIIFNYSYDVDNNITSYTSEIFYSNPQKMLYQYDSGRLIYILQQQFNGTDWIDQYRWYNNYDLNNDLTNSYSQEFVNDNWITTSQYTDNTYDSNHNRLSSTTYSSNTNTITHRETYLYDINNNQINKITEVYDYVTYLLDFQSQISTIYNIDNKMTNYLSQKWNGVEWYNYNQSYYNYDLDNLLKYKIYTKFNSDETIHFQDSIEFYYHIIINENPSDQISSTGIENNPSQSNFSSYPNPTTGIFKINSEERITSIEIFSIVGERIYLNQNIENFSTEIDLISFSKGTYLVKITYPESFFYSKIELY